ncbi:hypothetical protein RB628_40530, partial [Streptomyces sp. ADMS]|nr:hypothetical protein [Streptomyces sp. ADMS]
EPQLPLQSRTPRYEGRDIMMSEGTDCRSPWSAGTPMMSACSKSDSCVLVLVRLDGSKELIALAEGLRESSESWTDALRDVPAPRHIPAVSGRPTAPSA